MTLFQKQQTIHTSGYNAIPDAIADDETAAVPLGTPPLMTTTMGHRLSKWMIAIVACMMLVAGGTVRMVAILDGGRMTTSDVNKCLPAGGMFGGTSTTTSRGWGGKSDPFETCYQYGSDHKYCWTKSWQADTTPHLGSNYFQCVPNGGTKSRKPVAGLWRPVDPKYVNTPGVDPKIKPHRCGSPCQEQHED